MIDAKISFVEQLKEELKDQLTMEQISRMMSAAYRILDRFEMSEIPDEETETDDMLNSYVSALKVECRSQKTIDRYVYIIGKLMDFAKVPTRRVSVHHLRNFLTQEKERGICENTLEGYREIFSAYFNSRSHDPKYKGASRREGAAKARSKTFPGVAKAMAEQWG